MMAVRKAAPAFWAGTAMWYILASTSVIARSQNTMNADTAWNAGWSPDPPVPGAPTLVVSGHHILKPAQGWLLPWGRGPLADAPATAVMVGEMAGERVYVTERSEPDPALETVSLREALLAREDAPVDLLNTGVQVWHWWRDHRYCGRCGRETGVHPRERAKWCEPCQLPWYPRIAPCVIVVIRRGDRFLLARNARVHRPFYSLIAGFVEPGESLEQAVAREVLEETGLRVDNIRYAASQPWPFPHQLMVGFFADYAGGELVLQEDELADAGWFRPGDTPPVPPLTTIAGRLIQAMEADIRATGGGR